MTLSKDTQLQMIAFIKAHSDHLTFMDMTEELAPLGLTYNQIRGMCTKLDISPISPKAQAQKFILDYCRTRTVAQLAKSLNLCDTHVLRLCKELEVTPFKQEVKKEEPVPPPIRIIRKKGKTVSQLLSEFRMADAPHYVPPPASLTVLQALLT